MRQRCPRPVAPPGGVAQGFHLADQAEQCGAVLELAAQDGVPTILRGGEALERVLGRGAQPAAQPQLVAPPRSPPRVIVACWASELAVPPAARREPLGVPPYLGSGDQHFHSKCARVLPTLFPRGETLRGAPPQGGPPQIQAPSSTATTAASWSTFCRRSASLPAMRSPLTYGAGHGHGSTVCLRQHRIAAGSETMHDPSNPAPPALIARDRLLGWGRCEKGGPPPRCGMDRPEQAPSQLRKVVAEVERSVALRRFPMRDICGCPVAAPRGGSAVAALRRSCAAA